MLVRDSPTSSPNGPFGRQGRHDSAGMEDFLWQQLALSQELRQLCDIRR